MTIRILTNTTIAALLILMFAACGGGGGSPAGPAGGNDGPIAATITIDATGTVTPKDVTVPVGSRVTFVNNHSANHQIASDPHPIHTLCPPLNTVDLVAPGQSKTSSNLNTAMICTYHDHIDDTNVNLRGTIRVQ